MFYALACIAGVVIGILCTAGCRRRSSIPDLRERANSIGTGIAKLEADDKSVADSVASLQDTTKELGTGIDNSVSQAQSISGNIDRITEILETVRKRGEHKDGSASGSDKRP